MNINGYFIPKKGVLLDSSALVAFLFKDRGHKHVDVLLNNTACFVASVNLSEVFQTVHQKRKEPRRFSPLLALMEGLLKVYRLKVEAVMLEDVRWAGEQWRSDKPLSLGSRLCFAVRHRLMIPVVTADGDWGSSDEVIQIR